MGVLKDMVFPAEMDRDEYRARREELKTRLALLQQHAIKANMGTVILFEGWGASGKGSRISDLVVDLDSRAYSVHTMEEPVGYEGRLPFMARYWMRLGKRGTMTIFDQAYYDELSRAWVEDVRLQGDPSQDSAARVQMAARADQRVREHIRSARAFERQLTDDGFIIVKFFLHITRKMQSRRLMELMGDEASAWKVDQSDIRQIQHYDEYVQVYERWLTSDSAKDQWCLVPAEFRRNSNIQIMEELARRMEQGLRARGIDPDQPIGQGDALETPAGSATAVAPAATQEPTEVLSEPEILAREVKKAKRRMGDASKLTSRFELETVPDLARSRRKPHEMDSDDEYHHELKREQENLARLSLEMYRHRVPLIVAYEGWDAAGKGGNIKRLTAAMDARGYRVNPIGPASRDELARPFLWRFWNRLPRSGHTAIFDRTWYGRVLVERIEGFATKDEWRRAYDEINEFEDDLRIWGAVLVKFWIDVSPAEQLARFESRQADPARRWKITPDDWRNRAKNDLYYECVDDMVRLTSTPYAPWHIIQSDDKRYARVKALKIVNKALSERLEL